MPALQRAANNGRRSLPTRTAGHDAEWDKVRKHRDPRVTTLDPSTPMPKLAPNEFEINTLSFKYGLPPLPSLTDRVNAYNVDQSYYDRRDLRIRDHLDRLLRMSRMSMKEMLILIDQIESSHWNLVELQRAYLPEVEHASKDDYKKRLEEKEKARAENGAKPRKDTDDAMPKYGYRRDLANMGPECKCPACMPRQCQQQLSVNLMNI
jgi:hypothetical protein